MTFGLKTRATMRRSRVWSGGSMKTIIWPSDWSTALDSKRGSWRTSLAAWPWPNAGDRKTMAQAW